MFPTVCCPGLETIPKSLEEVIVFGATYTDGP